MAVWFEEVRDAVAAAFTAALTAAEVTGVGVHAMDEANPDAIDKPGVIVSYNAVEQEVGGTNVRDDYGYPIQLGLYTLQADNGVSGAEGPPGLTPTRFRQLLRETFHKRRAVAVAGIDCFLCEYDAQGANFDQEKPAYQQVKAAAVVTVYARVPRGA